MRHVVLLAEDATGYANLCRLLTDAHLLGDARRSVGRHRTDLRARRRADGAARAAVAPGAARGRPVVLDAAATLAAPYREAFGPERCVVAVEHRVEAGSDTEIRAMLRFAERLDATAVATNPVRYLAARRRVRRRRAGVHAPHRADRGVQRHAHQRRGLAEAARGDARAVRRAPGPVRPHPDDRRARARSTSGSSRSTSPTSRRRTGAAPTPCSPSGAGVGCTSAACARTNACATACTWSCR